MHYSCLHTKATFLMMRKLWGKRCRFVGSGGTRGAMGEPQSERALSKHGVYMDMMQFVGCLIGLFTLYFSSSTVYISIIIKKSNQ